MRKLQLLLFGLAFVLCGCSQFPARSVLIAAGGDHTCVLNGSGGVRCWGNNANGQLGNGTLGDSPLPVEVMGLADDIVAVAAGGQHSCALDARGRVWCWGGNSHGQLGNGTLADSAAAIQVTGLEKDIVAISAGERHTCALSAAGRASCWGANDYGQLGNLSKKDSPLPVAVTGLDGGIQAVAVGQAHTCALTQSGGVRCWGANAFGQLGNKTQKASAVPVDVSGLSGGVVAIAAGGSHSCALNGSGGVVCWGWDGNETTSYNALKPENVPGLDHGVSAITAGSEHTCALADGDRVLCWGSNYLGQLGRENLPASSAPMQVGGLGKGVLAIAAGNFHTCAVSPAAGVQCWGQNDQGELGIPNRLYSATPVHVSGLKSAVLKSIVVTAAPTRTAAPPTLVPWPLPTAPAALRPGQPVSLSWIRMFDAITGWGLDTAGHILRTTDGAATWKPANPPMAGVFDQRSFSAVDGSHARAVALPVLPGSDGCEHATNCHLSAVVWQTADGGASWQSGDTWLPAKPLSRPAGDGQADGPSSAAAHNSYFLDHATGWVLLEDWGPDTNILTVLARTVDGGKSLRELWRDEGIGRYTGVVFANKLVGYLGLDETTFFDRLSGVPALRDYLAGTEAPYLLKTSDGGHTWDVMHLPKLSPVPDALQQLAASDEHMLCGVEKLTSVAPQAMLAVVTCRTTGGFGPFSFTYASTDAGSTWRSWAASGNESFLDASLGWRLCPSGEFQQTADGGATWVTLNILPWQAAQFDFVSEQSGWALAQRAGTATLMRTVDGGHHWMALLPVVRQ